MTLLSTFPFTLVADVLGHLVEKAKCLEVSHLQFTDDILFFLQVDEEKFKNLLYVLESFCSFLGQCINMQKSVILGINAEDNIIHNLVIASGCEVGIWPIKYLGLPLGRNPRKADFWELVVFKVAKRLDG